MELESERIKLVPVSQEYAEDICQNLTPGLSRYLWVEAPKSLDEISQHISFKQKEMKQGISIVLVMVNKETQEFIGYMDVNKANSPNPELGLWVKESVHDQGYGYEALSLLVDWMKQNLEFEYLIYPVDKRNIASCKLAEKLGGVIEDSYLKKSEAGDILDEVEYRIYK